VRRVMVEWYQVSNNRDVVGREGLGYVVVPKAQSHTRYLRMRLNYVNHLNRSIY
jgi:hypothetical protein